MSFCIIETCDQTAADGDIRKLLLTACRKSPSPYLTVASLTPTTVVFWVKGDGRHSEGTLASVPRRCGWTSTETRSQLIGMETEVTSAKGRTRSAGISGSGDLRFAATSESDRLKLQGDVRIVDVNENFNQTKE